MTFKLTTTNSKLYLDYDILSITTIHGVDGVDLITHVVVEYLIMGIVMFFVYVNWVLIVRLSFYARTLMTMHVPKQF